VSEQTPPANYDYDKMPKESNATERATYITMGIILQAFGGVIVLVASGSESHLAGQVIGGVIAWVGVMLLFVGLVAVGVRLGTEDLLRSGRQ
jgi:hypothetical protein